VLKTRLISAAVAGVLFLLALFAAPANVFALLLWAVLLVLAWEWQRIQPWARLPWLTVAASALAGMLAMLVPAGSLLSICVVALAGWLLAGVNALKDLPTHRSLHAWLPVLAIAGAIAAVRYTGYFGPWAVLELFARVWAADTGAYFAGKRFGKNKLAPSISPGKTREGALGGMAMCALIALLFALFSPSEMPLWSSPLLAPLAALLIAPISVMGDLYQSRFKRIAGVKDSGTLMPGHGGAWDRLDAMLPASLLFVVLSALSG
jgi:phosphatidate cytidylyltransferase